MADVLDSGHVVTDEDVDTARLIVDLDRALGREPNALAQRVAAMTASRVAPVSDDLSRSRLLVRANGQHVPAADVLVRTLTSEKNVAEIAREVVRQLPEDMDAAEEERVVSSVTDVIRRRMLALLSEVIGGH